MTNLYKRLREIIPDKPLLVGQVVQINSSVGTSNVMLPGNKTVVARGTSVAVNSYAYVRDGVIEGPAASQFTSTIEI